MRMPDSRQEPTGDEFQLLNEHHCALCLIFYTVGADGSFILLTHTLFQAAATTKKLSVSQLNQYFPQTQRFPFHVQCC